MGMFDYVDFEAPCPACGAKVTGFQTKDSACAMETVKPWTVSNFYTSCDACGHWVEYLRQTPKSDPPEPPGWRDNYELKEGHRWCSPSGKCRSDE